MLFSPIQIPMTNQIAMIHSNHHQMINDFNPIHNHHFHHHHHHHNNHNNNNHNNVSTYFNIPWNLILPKSEHSMMQNRPLLSNLQFWGFDTVKRKGFDKPHNLVF
jgi:hypothetical protein